MTFTRAIELMKVELACIERNDYCGHDCKNCALAQDENELTQAYKLAIGSLGYGKALAIILNSIENHLDKDDEVFDGLLSESMDLVDNAMNDEEIENVKEMDQKGPEGSWANSVGDG